MIISIRLVPSGNIINDEILIAGEREHIVFLEVSRIIHKIIVDGEVSDLDCGARDNRFQIYCLIIIGTRINFILVHSLIF